MGIEVKATLLKEQDMHACSQPLQLVGITLLHAAESASLICLGGGGGGGGGGA